MYEYEYKGQKLTYQHFGDGETVFIWAHGWGHNHKALEPIAQSLSFLGQHYVIDFPGFGGSPKPETVWSVQDYADFMVSFIESLGAKKLVWIGHSFGCRVGLRIAASTKLISKMVLISAAGIPRKRGLLEQISLTLRVRFFKMLKIFVRSEEGRDKLRARFGSADYKNAADLRAIFIKTVQDNVSDILPNIQCPVSLIYGAKDKDTPPEIGIRLNNAIAKAQLEILPDFDHHTILTDGTNILSHKIKNFVEAK
jgi:pimeloyl-ACP methyl ester carboxylesterase